VGSVTVASTVGEAARGSAHTRPALLAWLPASSRYTSVMTNA
jgi:hypothetical protein